MPYQVINDINFNYELLGKNDKNLPLVLIPGYACDIDFWRSLAEIMSKDRQVLIFDNQGIGKTEDDGKPLSLEIMTANIKKLIESLHLKKPVLAGFAMGGVIAQKIALDFPNNISQLILLNSVMKFSEKAKSICEQLCVLREQNKLDDYCDLLYDMVFGIEFKEKITRKNFKESFLPIVTMVQSAKGQRRQVEVLKACDSTAWAKDIKVPTLVIASSEDQFAAEQECHALAKAIESQGTKVEFFIVQNSGHSTLVEQLEKITQLFQEKCLKHL